MLAARKARSDSASPRRNFRPARERQDEQPSLSALSREFGRARSGVVAAIRAYRRRGRGNRRSMRCLRSESSMPRCAALPRAERAGARVRLAVSTRSMRMALLPKDAADEKSAILEDPRRHRRRRGGLFAGDLFRMYQRYAEARAGRSRSCRRARAPPAASRRSSPR